MNNRMKNVVALMMSLIICWGTLPAPARAQKAQPAEQNFSTLIVGEQVAFLLASDGGLYPLGKNDKTAETPAISIDRETQYPFVWGDALWCIDKQQGSARQLYPESNADSAFSLNITADLASGAEDWYLLDARMEDGALYFLFGSPWYEYPELCRYRVEEKAYDRVSIPGLRGYVLQGAESALAISEGGDETLVSEVKWTDGQPQTRMRLQGLWEAFAWDDSAGLLYAADTGNQAFARFRAGRQEAVAKSPYGAGAEAGIVLNGQYLVFSRLGLHRPNFYAATEGERVLTVLFGAVDEADIHFMNDHPGVRVEYLSGGAYEGMDFAVALISGAISYDVGDLSNNEAVGEKLMDKGYCMDLSASPELKKVAEDLYKPFRDFAFRDGKLMMIPYITRLEGKYLLWEDKAEELGFTKEQLPQTLEELLDFLIAWKTERGAPESDEDIIAMKNDIYDRSLMTLLIMSMQAYAAHYRRTGQELSFDTPLFRRLLQKALMAEPAVIASPDGSNMNPVLYYPGADIVPPVGPVGTVIFPLTREEHPLYTGYVNGYIIDPRTEEPDLAMAYVLHRMNYLNEAQRMMLYEGEYTAAERTDYAPYLNRLIEERDALQQAIDVSDNTAEKRNFQEQLNSVTDRIEHPDDAMHYQYTAAEITFYQHEIVPNLELSFTDITTELSIDNADTWQLMKRFVDGEMDDENFISALNRRERMRRMENE